MLGEEQLKETPCVYVLNQSQFTKYADISELWIKKKIVNFMGYLEA